MATGRIGTTPVLQVRWSKAPSAGTTSLSGLDDNSVSLVYSVGYEAVYRNGVLLSRTNDYTATDGTTITLIDATIAGDIIEVFANQTIPLADTYSQTVANGKFINNTLTTTTGDIIYASAANTPARLGIGSTGNVLTVSGGVPAWAAPAGGGKVLQVVSMTKNTNFASTATTFTDVTGYSLSITPSSTNSKVLAIFNPNIYGGGLFDNQYLDAQIVRGSTAVYVAYNIRAYGGGTTGGYSWNHANLSLVYLDSPSTTSSTTYKMQLKSSGANDHGLNVTTGSGTSISSITLLEIGA